MRISRGCDYGCSEASSGPTFRRAFRGLLSLVAILGLAFFISTSISAQVQTADVVGTVTDASGGVLPGATVTLTNTGTSISQTTVTNGTGDFIFNLLQVGTYSLKVEAKGFKAFSIPSVSLSAGDRAREDAKLEVGDVTQTVEVSGNVAPALQTDSSNIGSLVTSQAVQDVPLNGRNFIKLVQLAPGVTIGGQNDTSSGNRPDDRRLTSEFTVNAQGTDINNNMIDGLDNNERFIGTIGVRPSVDAIQEVNVQTNLYDASVSRTGGGVVNVVTKSGTNSFHGSGYEFFRNRVLNTNPNYSFPSGYCATGATTCTPGSLLRTTVLAKPAFRQNQYGGSVGGPIHKNKTFFFFDYEKFGNALGLPLTATVPTTCMRGTKMVAMQAVAEHISTPAVDCSQAGNTTVFADPGNFSELTAISQPGGSNGSGASKSGAVIGLANENLFSLALFSLYPLPNVPGTSSNYISNPLRTQNASTFDIKIDQHISDKDSFSGRYSYNNTTTYTPTNFPLVDVKSVDPYWTAGDVSVVPGGTTASFPGPAKQRQQSFAFNYVHIFRPNLLLNLKAGYLRSATQSLTPNYPNNVTTAIEQGALGSGAGCNSTNCINFGPASASGLADFNPTGFTGLGESGFIPLQTFNNTFNYAGVVTWNRGGHSIRIGATLIRRQLTSYQSSNGVGSFSFTGIYTGVGPADFLEGLGATGARNYYLVSPGYRSWEPGTYIQDDWRTTRWLTLNIGIRYDIYTPFTEKRGRISNWDPASGLIESPSIPGAQQSGPTALVQTPYKDISPRFGFRASLPHDLVVGGGFGLTFYPQGNGTPQALRNAPFNFAFTCTTQVTSGANNVCTGPLNNGAVANFGAPASSQNSSVGQTGGISIANGLPVPFLNINQVFAPSVCTFDNNNDYSVASGGVGPTCPNNPYTAGISDPFWPTYTDGMLEQFNLQIQKQFHSNVITVGYVGDMGRHLGFSYSPSHISNSGQNGVNPLAQEYPWLAKTTVSENDAPWGTSSYNSLQATFVRRFSNGLTVQANYTWAHALSNTNAICVPTVSNSVLGFGKLPAYTNPCFYDNPANVSAQITETKLTGGFFGVGNTGLDVPNRVSGTINYQLPFAKSATGVLAVLAKGWTANDAFAWQTGAPFSITTGVQPKVGAVTGSVGSGRPDQVCTGNSLPKSLESWGVNPACFKLAGLNSYGDEHANQFFGPNNKNMDFSLFKDFALPVKEKLTLQFRAEIFNLFNTPNFSAPSSTAIASFGSAANTPGATADLQNPSNPTSLHLGAITSLNNNYNSRQIQFALKLLF